MYRSPLSGVFAPIVTVFDHNENICFDDIAYNIRMYNNSELSGYMPLGSNGEFQGLTDREAISVLRTVCRERAPGKVLVGGCGRESVAKTVEFIRIVASEGLDYAFLLPPHYFLQHTTEQGLFAFYSAIADRSPIPIVIYNAPKFTGGIGISPQLCSQLAHHENIIALKNSSTTPNIEYIQATKSADFVVLAGNIGTFYDGIREGAVGGVLSTASYLPEYCTQLFSLHLSGEFEKAAKLNSTLQKISQHSAGPKGVAGVKCAMDLRGMRGGHVRLPLLDVSPCERAQFAAVFSEYHIGTL